MTDHKLINQHYEASLGMLENLRDNIMTTLIQGCSIFKNILTVTELQNFYVLNIPKAARNSNTTDSCCSPHPLPLPSPPHSPLPCLSSLCHCALICSNQDVVLNSPYTEPGPLYTENNMILVVGDSIQNPVHYNYWIIFLRIQDRNAATQMSNIQKPRTKTQTPLSD